MARELCLTFVDFGKVKRCELFIEQFSLVSRWTRWPDILLCSRLPMQLVLIILKATVTGDVKAANTEADRDIDQTHRKIGSYLAFHHMFPLNRYIWRFIIGVQNRYVSFSHCYIEVRMLRWYSRVWRPWSLLNPARAPSFLRKFSSSAGSWNTFCADFGWSSDCVCSMSPAWLSHCFCEKFKSVYT